MSAESVIRQGRIFNQSLMTSECVISRESADPILDEETGLYESVPLIVYVGPCKVRFVSTVVSSFDAIGQMLAKQSAVLFLPVPGSEGVTVDDIAEITSSEMDASLVNRRIRISGMHAQTYATSRRFPAELIT